MKMSKETVYHGIQDDVQSVHSMYEVTKRETEAWMEGLAKRFVYHCHVIGMHQRGTDFVDGEQDSPDRL